MATCTNKATVLMLPDILDRGRGFVLLCNQCASHPVFKGDEQVDISLYKPKFFHPEAQCGIEDIGDGWHEEYQKVIDATLRGEKTELSEGDNLAKAMQANRQREDLYAFNISIAQARANNRLKHTHQWLWIAIAVGVVLLLVLI